jgi:hypothetical protein
VNSLRFVKELLLLAHPQAGQKGREERGRGDGETNIKREIYMRDTAVSEQPFANLRRIMRLLWIYVNCEILMHPPWQPNEVL